MKAWIMLVQFNILIDIIDIKIDIDIVFSLSFVYFSYFLLVYLRKLVVAVVYLSIIVNFPVYFSILFASILYTLAL